MRPASEVADQICGCAGRDQHQRDIALIETDRKQVREEVVREVAEWLNAVSGSSLHDPFIIHARALARQIEQEFLGREKA